MGIAGSVSINIATINLIAKTPRLHPSAGELVSPPVGGDFNIASEQTLRGRDTLKSGLFYAEKDIGVVSR
jgi:hypothetical protein